MTEPVDHEKVPIESMRLGHHRWAKVYLNNLQGICLIVYYGGRCRGVSNTLNVFETGPNKNTCVCAFPISIAPGSRERFIAYLTQTQQMETVPAKAKKNSLDYHYHICHVETCKCLPIPTQDKWDTDFNRKESQGIFIDSDGESIGIV